MTHVAARILEVRKVPLSPTPQQTPPVSEPLELIPLHSHVDEEVTEEVVPIGTGISLVDMIRAGGATQLPIGHGFDVLEEQPQATKPTVPDRDSSSDLSVDDQSSSSSSSSRSLSPSPPGRSARSRKRSSATRQQILLDSVLAKHMQMMEDNFEKRFDRLEEDVRKVSERTPAALGSALDIRTAPAATVPAVSSTLPQVEAHGQDTIRQSMQDRVAAWLKPAPPPPIPIPRLVQATKPVPHRAPSIVSMISDDPPQVGSEHAWRPTQLTEGTSEYDWDNQGIRVQVREDLATAVTQKVDEVVRVLGSVSQVLGFSQEEEPTVQPDLQPFGVSDRPKSSQPKLPLPQTMRDIWTEARKTRAGKPAPLVPSAVRATYRLPPDDWAFFGAIRRPDESLLEHCRTKPSSRQVPVLQRSTDGMAFDSFLSDIVQATAHLARPLAHGAHTVTMVSRTISVIGPIPFRKGRIVQAPFC